MENINCSDRVRSAEMLSRVNGESNILHTIKGIKVKWIAYILHRNCF